MARIPDSDRILRLLEGEGGSLGRRDIIEALGLSDDRYEEIVQQLVSKQLVVKNRGRAGGARLNSAPSGSLGTPEAPALADSALERDLYPAFTQYLLGAAQKGDESKSIVLDTHRTRAGKWETPDLTELRITPFPMVGQWELSVVTYELKRQGAWSIESVLQTATYHEFAHESWLVVPAGSQGDWVEYFGKRIVEKAGDLGIGLGTFDGHKNTLKKHMAPHRRHVPILSRQQEWLESVFERLSAGKRKEQLAAAIRWARSKAESGRD